MTDFSTIPIYKQLENLFTRKILTREWLPGTKIPSERQLAEKYQVNRLTVAKAINILAKQGLLIKKGGSGTFVNKESEDKNIRFDIDFFNNLKGKGLKYTLMNEGINIRTEVINSSTFSNIPYIAKKLNICNSDEIFGLYRLRLIKDEPFALELSFLPKKLFTNIDTIDFRHVSLYDYMNSTGHSVIGFDKQIDIIKANTKKAKLLKINANDDLYKIQYISKDYDNNLVEYTESYLLPTKIHLNFNITYK